jgi:hypothetical protein
MSKSINLVIEKTENGETTTKTVSHEVKKLNVLQFKQVMSTIKDISKEVSEDESLKELFGALTNMQQMENEEGEQKLDQDVITKAINSFETLAVNLPEHAFKLLSIVSKVKVEVLEEQTLERALDIYDTVLEVNNIEELINRAKKSLSLTQTMFKFKMPEVPKVVNQ